LTQVKSGAAQSRQYRGMDERTWQVFDIDELRRRVAGGQTPAIAEFLRTASLSCAVYRLPAGARDMQAPHLEDELYFVVAGHAKIRIAGQEHEVKPGRLLYVRATSEHSFFDIEEDLTLIAIFGAA
jgi:mannose-6-phosphate isomerase-like protein (cupin superfamily)